MKLVKTFILSLKKNYKNFYLIPFYFFPNYFCLFEFFWIVCVCLIFMNCILIVKYNFSNQKSWQINWNHETCKM